MRATYFIVLRSLYVLNIGFLTMMFYSFYDSNICRIACDAVLITMLLIGRLLLDFQDSKLLGHFSKDDHG